MSKQNARRWSKNVYTNNNKNNSIYSSSKKNKLNVRSKNVSNKSELLWNNENVKRRKLKKPRID